MNYINIFVEYPSIKLHLGGTKQGGQKKAEATTRMILGSKLRVRINLLSSHAHWEHIFKEKLPYHIF